MLYEYVTKLCNQSYIWDFVSSHRHSSWVEGYLSRSINMTAVIEKSDNDSIWFIKDCTQEFDYKTTDVYAAL